MRVEIRTSTHFEIPQQEKTVPCADACLTTSLKSQFARQHICRFISFLRKSFVDGIDEPPVRLCKVTFLTSMTENQRKEFLFTDLLTRRLKKKKSSCLFRYFTSLSTANYLNAFILWVPAVTISKVKFLSQLIKRLLPHFAPSR